MTAILAFASALCAPLLQPASSTHVLVAQDSASFQTYREWTRELTLGCVRSGRSTEYRQLTAFIAGPRFEDIGYEGRAGALLLAARMSAATDAVWPLLSQALSDHPDAYCADVAHLLAARLRRLGGEDALGRQHYDEALRLARERRRTWVAALEAERAAIGPPVADQDPAEGGPAPPDEPLETPSGEATVLWRGTYSGVARVETKIKRTQTNTVCIELTLPAEHSDTPRDCVTVKPSDGVLQGDTLSFWCYPLDDAPDLTAMVVDADGTKVSWALRRDELQARVWNQVSLRFAELRNGNSTISNDVIEAPSTILFTTPAYEAAQGADAPPRRWIIDGLQMLGASPAPVGTEPLRESHPLGVKITDTGDQDLWTAFARCTVEPEEEIVADGRFSARITATETGKPFAAGVLPREPWSGSQLSFRVHAPGIDRLMVIARKAGETGMVEVVVAPEMAQGWADVTVPLGAPGPVELVSFHFTPATGAEARAYVDDVRLGE